MPCQSEECIEKKKIYDKCAKNLTMFTHQLYTLVLWLWITFAEEIYNSFQSSICLAVRNQWGVKSLVKIFHLHQRQSDINGMPVPSSYHLFKI